MKDRLITIATSQIVYECIELLANQGAYARARGYEHRVVRETHWPDLHPSFGRVWEIHQALEEGCETVVWSDADVAFMDHTWQIADLVGGPYFLAAYRQTNWPPPDADASKQWAYLCAGLMVFRNTPEARRYVSLWIDRIENGTPHVKPGELVRITWHPFEQWLMDELNRLDFKYAGIRPCSAAEIGCFSRELWNDGTIWRPGMPTVHFAGTNPWSDRRQTFIDHYAHLVKGA